MMKWKLRSSMNQFNKYKYNREEERGEKENNQNQTEKLACGKDV